jgi:hypothetical protein
MSGEEAAEPEGVLEVEVLGDKGDSSGALVHPARP